MDTFTYKVNDGTTDSVIQTTTIELISFVVSTLADINDGNYSVGQNSLREAIANVPVGGTITFDPSISGGTILLGSELVINKSMTISGTVPITISGGNGVRVMHVMAGTVTFINFTITAGSSGGGGGGIYQEPGTTLSVDKMTVSYSNGPLGGGIYVNNAPFTMTNSTVNNNSATAGSGGGIYITGSSGIPIVENSTFFQNSATVNGGGASTNGGDTLFNFTTFSENSAPTAANIYFGVPSVANNMYNTILANGLGGGADCERAGGGFNTNKDLIENDGSCSPVASLFVDPNLATTLANNGSSTLTLALNAGSPAINYGINCNSGVASFDQRGMARGPGTNQCDLGAYEYNTASRPSPMKLRQIYLPILLRN
jgi:hypothetical protein